MASELKRCDCGSEADCPRYGTTGYYSICRNPSCGAQTALYRRKYQAVASWNRRAPFTVSRDKLEGAVAPFHVSDNDLSHIVHRLSKVVREAGGEVTDA